MSDGKSDGGDDDDAGGLVATKKEFIQTFFKRAGEFTEELLRENERLRYRILQLEAAEAQQKNPGAPSSALKELVSRIESLEAERDNILTRARSVEAQNQDFDRRYKEIERENNNLANLYVASFQLHSTLELREVVQTILEILLNFVGAKMFAILLVDAERGVLRTLAAEGIDRERVPEVKLTDDGVIGRVVSSGKAEISDAARKPLDLQHPAIVTPLRIKDRVVGAIVIWDFLQQKTRLEEVDHELFNLLAAHAASALQAAKLTSELDGRALPLWSAVDLVTG
jgi:hypothetical protein